MGCQKKIAQKIVGECKSDYVLNVKGNQEGLLNDAVECFNNFEKEGKIKDLDCAYKLLKSNGKPLGDEHLSMIKTVECGHGRIEKRTYYYTQDI